MGHGASKVDETKTIGNRFFSEGQYEKALGCYSLALSHVPDNHVLLSNRCQCYLKLQLFGFALEDALHCKRVEPGWVKSYFRLAQVFLAMEMYGEARLLSLQALAFSPRDPTILNLLEEAEKAASDLGAGNLYEWTASQLRPQLVGSLKGVVLADLACGVSHCVGVSNLGEVYVWGDNRHSQCGVTGSDLSKPTLLPGLLGKNVTGVACGGVHSVVVCADGSVYAWGVNVQQQCGVSQPAVLDSPTLVSTGVAGVAAGLAHTLMLTASGRVQACGWNNCGQLGLGHNRSSPLTELGLARVTHLSCGGAHSLAVTSEGDLLSTGSNTCGQLGLGHAVDVFSWQPVRALDRQVSYSACGEEYSIAVTRAGLCYSFGLGNVGQLGDGKDTIRELPEQVRLDESVRQLYCSKTQVIATTDRAQTFSWGSWAGVPQPPNLVSSLSSLRAHQVRAARESFYIMTKYSDPLRSFLNDLPVAGLIAGTTHSLTLELVDNDGLFVVSKGDSVQCVAVSETGRSFVSRVEFSRGKYHLQLSLNQAGVYRIYALVNSACVRFAPYEVRVKPSFVEYATAYVSLQLVAGSVDSLHMHAGSELQIEVEGQDSYYNQCDAVIQAKDLTVRSKEASLAFSLHTASMSRNLVKVQLSQAGSHEVKVLFKGREVPIVFQGLQLEDGVKSLKDVARRSSVPVRVYPGVLAASACSVTQTSTASRAGQSWKWLVSHKDQFNNDTWHKLEAFEAEFSIQGQKQPCLQRLAYDSCSTEVEFASTLAGLCVFTLKYSQFTIYSQEFQVQPGPPAAAHCAVAGEGLNSTVFNKGSQLTRQFEVTLRDSFDNLTSTADLVLRVFDDQGACLNSRVDGNVCFYYVTRVGTYTIDLVVEGERLLGFPIRLAVVRDPREVEAERVEAEMQALREARIKAEEAAALKARLEREAQEAAEKKRLEEARRRAEAEAAKILARKATSDELELEKRRRIVQRIKNQEETDRRAAEALDKLRAMKKEEKPKARRTGGGFVLIEF